jgi:uncharacterized MnhB-related membrane protein
MNNNSKISTLFISVISAFYAFLFIITSNHIEFIRLFPHSKTLNSVFWNCWSTFVQNGNMKYMSYVIIILTTVIIFLTIFKKQKYNEYEIMARGFVTAGIISVFLFPLLLLLVLSDINYAIESMFLIMSIQWISVLIVNLFYITKYFK